MNLDQKQQYFNTIIITQYTTNKRFAKITFSWETHLDQLGLRWFSICKEEALRLKRPSD